MTDVPAWIALGIALYGGALSTFNAVIERRRHQQGLTRDLVVTGRVWPSADPTKAALMVRAYNSGQRPVHVIRAGVVLQSGIIVWHGPTTPRLPAGLADGESIEIPLTPDWLDLVRASMRQDIVGFAVEDASRTPYVSERAAHSEPSDAPEPPSSG